MDAKDLKDWRVCRNFTQTVGLKKIYVFENLALMLKNDGNLYGRGRRGNALIREPISYYNDFTLVTDLDTPHIEDFTTNGEHALAISKDGMVFSWGQNTEGQLGRSGDGNTVEKVTNILGVRIAKISCGHKFSFVLTTDGKLYEWGINGFKELMLDCSSEVTKSNDQEESERISISIVCVKYYPVALTKTGKVFIPVFPRTITCNNCIKFEKLQAFGDSLKGKKVIQVLSGKSHAFALTDNGEIFRWTILPDSANDPEQIDVKIGRPIKLWTSTSKDILVVTNSYGHLFSIFWIGTTLVSQLSFPSVGKYFAQIGVELSGPAYDKEWQNVDNEGTSEVSKLWSDRFESAFNKEVGSDIVFKVGEGVIYAHEAIVSIQCSYLRTMLNNNWTEKSENRTIVIKKYTNPTYLRFLRYLYTGKLELDSQERNLELLQLAHEYDEKHLLEMCEKMAITGFDTENVFSSYKIASLLGLMNLRDACKLYMSKNLEEVFCSDDMSTQENDVLIRSLRDMILSGNVIGQT